MRQHICVFALPFYARLYHSFRWHAKLSAADAAELAYLLNTANQDTAMMFNRETTLHVSSPARFVREIRRQEHAHDTIYDLSDALSVLHDNIRWSYLTQSQRNAVLHMEAVQEELLGRIDRAEDRLLRDVLRALEAV